MSLGLLYKKLFEPSNLILSKISISIFHIFKESRHFLNKLYQPSRKNIEIPKINQFYQLFHPEPDASVENPLMETIKCLWVTENFYEENEGLKLLYLFLVFSPDFFYRVLRLDFLHFF